MLDSIHVKDLALIKEARIDLGQGLNILTGETGAGKSLIIGSLNLCLGGKADKEMIREGAEYALVELVFSIGDGELAAAVKALDMPLEEDGTLIITRKISAGKSRTMVCGESVTVKQVRELATLLLDVHGQHEHQSLLRNARQRELLDAYAGEDMHVCLDAMRQAWHEYNAVKDRIAALDTDESVRAREISLAEYEISEIEEAGIKPGEEAALDDAYREHKRKMENYSTLSSCALLLSEDGGVLDKLGRCIHEMNGIKDATGLSDIREAMESAEDSLNTALRDIRKYTDDDSFSPEEFDRLEKRLDTVRNLMLKYGQSEEAVLDYLEKTKMRLAELKDAENTLKRLEDEAALAVAKMDELCRKIRKMREKAAKTLEAEICDNLKELNFLKVDFEISIREAAEYGIYGKDEVEFVISTNPGEAKRPLADVASGGELSRIMLALKCVFAKKDRIGTLVFDEIDTGISGATAWKVSEMMGKLSRTHQLICITHLPQIAAMADSHYLIEKSEQEGRTISSISLLDDKERVAETARMLGTTGVTEASLRNAKELIEEALAVKGKK